MRYCGQAAAQKDPGKLMIQKYLLPSLLLTAVLLIPIQSTQAGQPDLPGAKPVQPQAAHLDKAFGGFGADGTVSGNFGPGDDEIAAIAIQPWDGRIVAVGTSQGDFAVSRFLRDGSLDTSFSEDGKVLLRHGLGDNTSFAAGVLPDGKVTLAGCMADFNLGYNQMLWTS